MKCWKKSQSSSGYYKKPKGKMAEFIRFNMKEDGRYEIDFRKGMGGTKEFKNIATKKNKSSAIKFANKYMKSHDKC